MGLLDQIFANPEATNALAAGLLQGNFAGGLLGMDQVRANQRKEQMAREELAMKKGLLDAQISNYQSEAEARKLKGIQDARMQGWIGQLFGEGGPSATGASGASGSAPAMPGGVPAAVGGVPASIAGNPQALNLMRQAEELKIPREAILSDMVFNGGKKISEFLESRSKPKWENINGNLVNTNDSKFTGGFQPGMSVSSNGQTTMWQPDGRGGLVFGAPPGAVDTYRAYQNAGEATKAAYDTQPITGRDGQTSLTTRGNIVRDIQSAGYNGGSRDAANAESIRIMRAELEKPGLSPENRAAIQREIGRLQMQSPGVGGIPIQSKAQETADVDTAKANVVRDTGRLADSKRAGEMIANTNRAIELLKEGPTSSKVGAVVDALGATVGKSWESTNKAARLDALSGWMVANVPRMEGPQSNIDVQNYTTMAGRVGDRMLPVKTRLAAAEEVLRLQQKYAHLNGLTPNTGGASGEWGGGGGKVVDFGSLK